MSEKLKYFLYGLAIGVTAGFTIKLIADKRKEKRDEKIKEDNDYQELLDELNREDNEKAEKMITEEQNRKKEEIFEEIFSDYESKASKYSPLIHSDEDGASYDFDDEMEDINKEIEEQDMKKQEAIDKGYNTDRNCYFIYPDDYTDDGLNDGIELVFCSDGTLVRVEDESIANVAALFGGDIKLEDIYRKFEMESYQTIYVRKSRDGIDYAIEWTDQPYKEAFGEE